MAAKKNCKPGKCEKKVLDRPDWDVEEQWIIGNEQLTIEDRAAPGTSTRARSMTNEQRLAQLDELMEDPSMWRKPRPGRPLRLDEPEPRWLVRARRSVEKEGFRRVRTRPGSRLPVRPLTRDLMSTLRTAFPNGGKVKSGFS